MNSRLATLLELTALVPLNNGDGESGRGRSFPSPTMTSQTTSMIQPEIAPGWRSLAGSDTWKPSPIGVYVQG